MDSHTDWSSRIPEAQMISAQLKKILSSETFRRVPKQRTFLQFVVESRLHGRAGNLKLTAIAQELFNSDDGAVRVAASQTRSKLSMYYHKEGKADPIQIDIPVGSYVPEFTQRSVATPPHHRSRRITKPLESHFTREHEGGADVIERSDSTGYGRPTHLPENKPSSERNDENRTSSTEEMKFISISQSQPSLHLGALDLKCKLFPTSAWSESPAQTYTDDPEDEFGIELIEKRNALPNDLLSTLMLELETVLRGLDVQPTEDNLRSDEWARNIREVHQRLRSERSNAYPRLAGIPKIVRDKRRAILQIPIAASKYGVALIREKRISLPTAQKLALSHILNSLAVRIAYVYKRADGTEWVELQQRQIRRNATFSGAWDVSAAGYIDPQKHQDPAIKLRISPSQACADELAKELSMRITDLPYRDNYYFFGVGRNDETGQVDILGYCLGSTVPDPGRDISPFVSRYDRCRLEPKAIVKCVLEKKSWVPTALLTLILLLESRGGYSRRELEEVFMSCTGKLDLRADQSQALVGGLSEASTTRLFANAFNAGGRRIVGSVIETHAHPNLESGLPLSEVGWSESEVSLRLRQGIFRSDVVLSDPAVDRALEEREAENRRDGRASILTPPNGVKYAVVDASSPFLDVNDFTVTVQETRYFSIMRARPAVESSILFRKKFGHVEPHKNRIPHAVGLQFIALFADRQVLAIQRAKDTFPFPGTWSFSGEEQCAPIDLLWDERHRMKNYLLRTVVEEVFPLARIPDPAKLRPEMEEAQQHMADMRIVGLLLEEPIVTFSFFVIFKLKITTKEYRDEVICLVRNGRGQMSREGLYFCAAVSDLPLLLEGGEIPAKPIFGDRDERIAASNLHPTSLYRVARLLELVATRR